jgi:hypothetical protein
MALSSTLYLDSEDGGKLLEEVDLARGVRKDRMDKLGSQLVGANGLRAEAVISGRYQKMMAASTRPTVRPTTRATTRAR